MEQIKVMEKEQKYFHITCTNKSDDYFNAYYAVDDEGWTERFIEVKINGSLCIATELIQIGDTSLPEATIYPIQEVNDSGCDVKEISQENFNEKWLQAVEFARKNKLHPLLTGVIY